jgi:dethiobiotin synthetase
LASATFCAARSAIRAKVKSALLSSRIDYSVAAHTRLQIDVFARWRAPVVLCARTTLGTINHTLLSIEALRRRDVPLLGIAFIGDEMADTERTIADLSAARVLGRLPRLDPLTPTALAAAM